MWNHKNVQLCRSGGLEQGFWFKLEALRRPLEYKFTFIYYLHAAYSFKYLDKQG